MKFDLAHFIATEKIAFSKYPALCKLEAHHGVNVGTKYNNEHTAKTFCHYTAETRRQDLAENLTSAKFFSLLMDGTCDSGNIDNKMLLVVWCDTESSDEKVHTRMTYFSLTRPKDATGAGLFQCLQASLQALGILAINAEECKKLVGIRTDGASLKVAAGAYIAMPSDRNFSISMHVARS